jgi:hypothetical protein
MQVVIFRSRGFVFTDCNVHISCDSQKCLKLSREVWRARFCACPHCGGVLHRIGEDVSEALGLRAGPLQGDRGARGGTFGTTQNIGHLLFPSAGSAWACYTVAMRRARLHGLHAVAPRSYAFADRRCSGGSAPIPAVRETTI